MLSPQNDKEKSPKIAPNDHSNHILLATIVSFNYIKYFFDFFFFSHQNIYPVRNVLDYIIFIAMELLFNYI